MLILFIHPFQPLRGRGGRLATNVFFRQPLNKITEGA